MRIPTPPQRARADNTIALINVVFLMLIFFLFAGSVEQNDAHDITPPDVSMETEKTNTGGALVVQRDGTMTLKGQPVALEDLARLLAAQADEASQSGGDDVAGSQPLRIVADKELPARMLSDILTAAREAGRVKISLVARQIPSGSEADALMQSSEALEGAQ
ncbi:biopolymer transporter ExbD [Breoghania sp.]|uniref:ExbD/TolR family protein n=1 Tax=Breoghania sp. TaxID=2065378 RepID=UPI002AAB12BE|nr:biopolymer transporter ExbD [Breoghania sp.]